jgi:hypothetical protein
LLAFMLAFWEAVSRVEDGELLDWGVVACGAADDLVPGWWCVRGEMNVDEV